MAENMRLLIDLFGQPEACLIADIIQHLSDRKTEFDPGTTYPMLHTTTLLMKH